MAAQLGAAPVKDVRCRRRTSDTAGSRRSSFVFTSTVVGSRMSDQPEKVAESGRAVVYDGPNRPASPTQASVRITSMEAFTVDELAMLWRRSDKADFGEREERRYAEAGSGYQGAVKTAPLEQVRWIRGFLVRHPWTSTDLEDVDHANGWNGLSSAGQFRMSCIVFQP